MFDANGKGYLAYVGRRGIGPYASFAKNNGTLAAFNTFQRENRLAKEALNAPRADCGLDRTPRCTVASLGICG
jgi:hypothetical protein